MKQIARFAAIKNQIKAPLDFLWLRCIYSVYESVLTTKNSRDYKNVSGRILGLKKWST